MLLLYIGWFHTNFGLERRQGLKKLGILEPRPLGFRE